jgi:hypothetical protein
MKLEDKVEVEGWINNLNIVDKPMDYLMTQYELFSKYYRMNTPQPLEQMLNVDFRNNYNMQVAEYSLRMLKDLYGDK